MLVAVAVTARALALTAVVLTGYTYAGYPLLISLGARRRGASSPRPLPDESRPNNSLPSMTVVVAAYDEEAVITARVADAFSQDYPAGQLQVIVVADGSTDQTSQLAEAAGAQVLWEPDRGGKSAAVNRGIAACTSELICLTDANCSFAPNALRAIAAAFSDPHVAVVSGAKTVAGSSAHGEGEGLYWRLEARLKTAESRFGLTSGAPGEIAGLRRSATRRIPPHVINDDFHLATDALSRGLRVAYAPGAVATESVSPTLADEYERRSRIAAGTWQTCLDHLGLAHPAEGWGAVVFVSHRLLRSMIVPMLLGVLPVLTLLGLADGRRTRAVGALAAAQATLVTGAAAGACGMPRLAPAMQFILTNAASVRGGIRIVRGRQPVAWRRVDRAAPEGETRA